MAAPLREYALPPHQRLAKASLDYADAPAEDDKRFNVLWKLLRIAALKHARSRGVGRRGKKRARKNVHRPDEATHQG